MKKLTATFSLFFFGSALLCVADAWAQDSALYIRHVKSEGADSQGYCHYEFELSNLGGEAEFNDIEIDMTLFAATADGDKEASQHIFVPNVGGANATQTVNVPIAVACDTGSDGDLGNVKEFRIGSARTSDDSGTDLIATGRILVSDYVFHPLPVKLDTTPMLNGFVLELRHSDSDWSHGYCIYGFDLATDPEGDFRDVSVMIAPLVKDKEYPPKELVATQVGGEENKNVYLTMELPCGTDDGADLNGEEVTSFRVTAAQATIDGKETDLLATGQLQQDDYVFEPLPITIGK